MSNTYAIVDVVGYATQMREAAAENLCENHSENLDSYITIKQMINLVNSECVGFDNQDRPLLDEETNGNIFDKVSVWIHNCGLAKLAAQDLIECAWDDNANEMIFWSKPNKVSDNAKSQQSSKSKKKSRNKKS
jgi:hypothetical protein